MTVSPVGSGGSRGRRKQKKSVTVTYGAMTGSLLLIVAAMALIVKPPSPPALAEFAPQTDDTIDDTSQNQSSRFGTGGDGICAPGQLGCEGVGRPPDPEAEEPEQDTPQVPRKPGIKCVQTPGTVARQIDDPQSPPCAEPWQGDNGGTTAMGVTGDEIRVALAPSRLHTSIPEFEQVVRFFNDHFEFYGRRIVLVDRFGAPRRSTPPPETENQRQVADYVAEVRPFAALRMGLGTGSQFDFRKRLADHGVITVGTDDDYTSEAQLRALHPFAWNYHLSYDRLLTDLAQFVCGSLIPGTAEYAGPGLRDSQRAVGVVNVLPPRQGYDGTFGDIRPFLDGLQACGGAKLVKEYQYGSSDSTRAPARSLLSDFRTNGVTTVVPLGSTGGATELMSVATSSGYDPEWLLAGGGNYDQLEERWQSPSHDASQVGRLFALGGWNKGLPVSDRPSTWAFREQGVDPGLTNGEHRSAELFYQAMLVVASGIQAAGERLTPDSFARGLQQTRFPNPGAGAAPYYQATVGFTGDHTMIDDEAVQWWSAAAPAYRGGQEQGGGWCYADRGTRWRRDQWPQRTFRLFASDTCR